MLSFLRFGRRAGSVPADLRLYVIGDIHGRADLLGQLLHLIDRDIKGWRDRVAFVFVGDYVDRGPDSRLVIEQLIGFSQAADAVFLRGNHDQALLNFLSDPATYRSWREFGGPATLRSYGVHPPSEDPHDIAEARNRFSIAFPPRHRQFLQSLVYSHTVGDYFIAHAGARPGKALADQSEEDLMWIRDDFLNNSRPFDKIVIHGHSPTRHPVRNRCRIGIDTGAYISGKLTSLVLQGRSTRFLQT